MNNSEVLAYITGVTPYSFEDEKSKRLVEGINVFHLIDGDRERGELGQVPGKITLPYHFLDKLKTFEFPCFCRLKREERLGKKGMITKISDIDYVEQPTSSIVEK